MFSDGPSLNSHENQSRIYRVGAERMLLRSLYMNSSLDHNRSDEVLLARRTTEG